MVDSWVLEADEVVLLSLSVVVEKSTVSSSAASKCCLEPSSESSIPASHILESEMSILLSVVVSVDCRSLCWASDEPDCENKLWRG